MKRTLIFDTSAINALAKSEDSASLEAGLKVGFRVRQTYTAIAEILANSEPAKREMLRRLCCRLLPAGDCITRYDRITRPLVAAHKQNPGQFRWQDVDPGFPDLERELADGELFTSELAELQLKESKEQDQEFISLFRNSRNRFEEIFEQKRAERPTDLRELIRQQQGPGGAFWSFGLEFYDRPDGTKSSEETIREFVSACPPFRAMLLAIFVAQFQYSIKLPLSQNLYKAGKCDLFSAVYLPYCDKFVTNDAGQLNALKAIAEIGQLEAEVISFAEWVESMTLNTRA